MFPISKYFRVLVVGQAYKPIADIVGAKLGFRTSLCSSAETASVIHGGVDIAAIVVGRAAVGTAGEARGAHGFAMPIFLSRRRVSKAFEGSSLVGLSGVFIDGPETLGVYGRRSMASVEKYVDRLTTPSCVAVSTPAAPGLVPAIVRRAARFMHEWVKTSSATISAMGFQASLYRLLTPHKTNLDAIRG